MYEAQGQLKVVGFGAGVSAPVCRRRCVGAGASAPVRRRRCVGAGLTGAVAVRFLHPRSAAGSLANAQATPPVYCHPRTCHPGADTPAPTHRRRRTGADTPAPTHQRRHTSADTPAPTHQRRHTGRCRRRCRRRCVTVTTSGSLPGTGVVDVVVC